MYYRQICISYFILDRIVKANQTQHEPVVNDEVKEESEDIEVTENVENVIGLLLNSLSENSTVVRWNAAKQLGRVAERLDQENGTYLVSQALELLDLKNSEDTWHGAMSALAEFSRRNLIVEQLIPEAIEKVVQVRHLKFQMTQFLLERLSEVAYSEKTE